MAESTENHVFDRVKGVIEEVLKVEGSTVEPGSNFKSDLGADSLDLMTLVVALEEEFDGTIDDDDVAEIKTVDDAVQLIQNQIVKSE